MQILVCSITDQACQRVLTRSNESHRTLIDQGIRECIQNEPYAHHRMCTLHPALYTLTENSCSIIKEPLCYWKKCSYYYYIITITPEFIGRGGAFSFSLLPAFHIVMNTNTMYRHANDDELWNQWNLVKHFILSLQSIVRLWESSQVLWLFMEVKFIPTTDQTK